ncbi:MAG: hypothetical protein FJX77_03785, partial [Armatimonadetes bacterium]|nr:hypothetical protein [Armatimonadota bacterium]
PLDPRSGVVSTMTPGSTPSENPSHRGCDTVCRRDPFALLFRLTFWSRIRVSAVSGTGDPLLILTQGHAGDRLGARLASALASRFPGRPLVGLGGPRLAGAGVTLLARTDGLSAMGYTGLPAVLFPALRAAWLAREGTRRQSPAVVIAVDFWQPLAVLHRLAPHLLTIPHICYLPPGPNFVGSSRVHWAAATRFHTLLTPFPHQQHLFSAAGGRVLPAAHAGLEIQREEARPLAWEERRPLLALLPGSRELEIRYSLPAQAAVARRIRERHPELQPIACCVNTRVEAWVRRSFPDLRPHGNAREVLAQARLGLICSGTAVLEAAVAGCPGVATYYASPLQQWEWNRFHVPKLRELRSQGIASPYITLPNILAGRDVYPEALGLPAEAVTELAERQLARDPRVLRQELDTIRDLLAWNDAGAAVAGAVAAALGEQASPSAGRPESGHG